MEKNNIKGIYSSQAQIQHGVSCTDSATVNHFLCNIFFYVHHVMSAGIFGGKKLRTLEAMNGSCRVCAFRFGIKFLIMNAINHDPYISEN